MTYTYPMPNGDSHLRNADAEVGDNIKPDRSANVSTGHPKYHFAAKYGWINDPCAPGYDPSTGLYHLFFQWNPKDIWWGDISWGHATSRDMLHWKLSSDKPVFVPDQPYDCEGVFTGCFHPTGPSNEANQLTVLYSSICGSPIAYDKPHIRGSEGVSMAVSADGGKTWKKDTRNPIVRYEPGELHVTGFRDPSLTPWPALDVARGRKEASLYATMSGGLHGAGPRLFLYEVDPNDLTQWKYLHPLIEDVPTTHFPAGRWGGDLGLNWECANFFSLSGADASDLRHMVIVGSEGGVLERDRYRNSPMLPSSALRDKIRHTNWFFGSLGPLRNGSTDEANEVRMSVDTAGMLDWGLFYACASFIDARGRRVAWGWIVEEDLPKPRLAAKGFTGSIGIPRELFLQTVENVIGTCSTPIEQIGSMDTTKQDDGTFRVVTLGIRPLPDLTQLRGLQILNAESCTLAGDRRLIIDTAPLAMEIKASIQLASLDQGFTLHVRHNGDMSTRTSIVFSPVSESIRLVRQYSNTLADVNVSDAEGSFTLLRRQTSCGPGLETLDLRVFLDGDIIELFANDRFALTTRVFTPADISSVSLECGDGVVVKSLEAWEMQSIGLHD